MNFENMQPSRVLDGADMGGKAATTTFVPQEVQGIQKLGS